MPQKYMQRTTWQMQRSHIHKTWSENYSLLQVPGLTETHYSYRAQRLKLVLEPCTVLAFRRGRVAVSEQAMKIP